MPSKSDHARKSPSGYKDNQMELVKLLKVELPRHDIQPEHFIEATHFFDFGNNIRYFVPKDDYYPLKKFVNELEDNITLTLYKRTSRADICIDEKYIIEIDGITHETLKQEDKDFKKDVILRDLGYKIIRIKDSELRSKKRIKEWVLKIKRVVEEGDFNVSTY